MQSSQEHWIHTKSISFRDDTVNVGKSLIVGICGYVAGFFARLFVRNALK